MDIGSSALLGIRSRWMIGVSLSCALGVAGAQSRKLSGELAHGGLAPESFALTPDGARVVYLGSHASEFHFDVFSAPADGTGEPVRLSARFEYPERSGDAPSIERFWIVPDGRVAFAADHVFQEHHNFLFVVPADGSAPQQLVASSHQAITAARFTPDGQRVVFLATSGYQQPFELYSAPLDGSAPPTRLAGPPAPELGNVHDFQLSTDGATVVFTLDEGVPGCEFCAPTEALVLLAVPVDGSAAPTPLARLRRKQQHLGRPPRDVPFADFHGESVTSYALAPDGSRVLFTTETLFGDCPGGGCRREGALWSVPLAGGAPATQLFANRALEAVIAADSSLVVFLAEVEATGQLELQAVPIDGSQPARRLHGALPGDATVFEFALAPDTTHVAAHVAFSADLDGSGEVRLFGVGLEGGPPRALSPRAVLGGTVSDFRITADGAWVVYRGDLEQDERIDLYAAPLPTRPFARRRAGPAPARGGRLSSGADVLEFVLTPDSVLALYTAFEDGLQHLFTVPLDGSGPPVRLSGEEGGRAPLSAPDGSFAVYEGTVANLTTLHVFRASLAGGAPPVRLDGRDSDPVFGDVESFLVSPDGKHAVYRADAVEDEFFELFGVALDERAPPVRLDPPGAADDGVLQDYQIDRDSTHVVYRLPVGPSGATQLELHAAPIGGETGPVRLHGELPPGGHVLAFAAGAGRAAFLANAETVDVAELYSAALDGEGGALRLSGPLVAGGDVGSLYLVPDGTRVVYLADALANDQVELFSVPIDGSAAPLKLSGLLGFGRDVAEPIVIAPDGQHVLFTADRDVNDAFELFSVPIDASAAPLKLTPGGGRDALSARFSADASTLAFVAHLPSTNVSELYAAPLGVVPAAALVTLTPGNFFAYFELTPDGSRMVYTAGRVQQRFDLFGVPVDGSVPPVRLNLPGGGDRDVELTPRPRLSADGSRVVFIGDPVFSNHDELFSAAIDGSAPAVRLHPPLPESSKVEAFELVPGANEAVYMADAEQDSVEHLYRVPLDGSRAPLRVDDPRGSLPRFGSTPYRLTPDGKRVLFLSDIDVTSVIELFVALLEPRLHGAGAPTGSTQRGF